MVSLELPLHGTLHPILSLALISGPLLVESYGYYPLLSACYQSWRQGISCASPFTSSEPIRCHLALT